MKQQIRFCRSYDGTRIAYAVTGEGPTLVKGAALADEPRVRGAEPDLATLADGAFQRPLAGAHGSSAAAGCPTAGRDHSRSKRSCATSRR
jgi:hypothetical protein